MKRGDNCKKFLSFFTFCIWSDTVRYKSKRQNIKVSPYRCDYPVFSHSRCILWISRFYIFVQYLLSESSSIPGISPQSVILYPSKYTFGTKNRYMWYVDETFIHNLSSWFSLFHFRRVVSSRLMSDKMFLSFLLPEKKSPPPSLG